MENSKLSVAIFPGSFNPITVGHLAIIRDALKRFDKVWLIPKRDNTHKLKPVSLVPYSDRVVMCNLALKEIEGETRVKVNLEDSVDTLEDWNILVEKYPNFNFALLLGSDIANKVDTWQNFPEILSQIIFIVYNRQGYPIKYSWNTPHQIVKIDIPPVSSTVFRRDRLENIVTRQVWLYILSRKLYV